VGYLLRTTSDDEAAVAHVQAGRVPEPQASGGKRLDADLDYAAF
jgi:hypothetical protein